MSTPRQVRRHPPVNGCTISGLHACILTTGEGVPTVLELHRQPEWVKRAQAHTLPCKDMTYKA